MSAAGSLPIKGTVLETLKHDLHPERLRLAKKAYTTRHLAALLEHSAHGYWLESDPRASPEPGDVVLARVESIGHLKRLESPESRRQMLFVGDEILVVYGNRYAPAHVLAEVPKDLGPCHLAAAGGIAASVSASHSSLEPPTSLLPLGLLVDDGGRVTLSRVAPHQPAPVPSAAAGTAIPVMGVVGTAMNSGKSTAAACLIRGLTAAGLRVGAAKATGTGAGGDLRLFQDAGAARFLDFTDFGYPSTFKVAETELIQLLDSIVAELSAEPVDAVVLEISDGLYQDETCRLVDDGVARMVFDRVLFAAADSLGAVAGVERLKAAGVDVAAVSGVLTASPLAAAEASRFLEGVPLVETYSLAEPAKALQVLGALARA